jgi:hypothetical protein
MSDPERSAKMNLELLRISVPQTDWFSKVGSATAVSGAEVLRSLSEEDDDLPLEWEWLPTTQSDIDPFHGDSHRMKLDDEGMRERRQREERQFMTAALAAIPERISNPGFVVGPHDFSGAARGAAVYAMRMAVRECLADQPGIWCRIAQIYFDGRWPCGLVHTRGTLVVV